MTTSRLGGDQVTRDAHCHPVAANQLGWDQRRTDAHAETVPANQSGRDQSASDAHRASVPANPLARDQRASEAHPQGVAGKQLDGDQCERDTHGRSVAVEEREGGVGQPIAEAHSGRADPANALILVLADALDDVERTRIANQNRLRSLTTVKELPRWSEASVRLGLIVYNLEQVEKSASQALERAMKAHPLGPWVMRTRGVGLKQAARLLAAIGDPMWNGAEGRPRRGPAELWAFCGYRPDQRLRKGVKANWNTQAKMRARLVAESCIKHATSPYRPIYDRERAKWAERDTTDLHRHNHALRCVAKTVLRDLFLEARALDHRPRESQ